MRPPAPMGSYTSRTVVLRVVLAAAVFIGLAVALINLSSVSIIVVFAALAFVGGLLMAYSGVAAALITVAALGIYGELIDTHPLSLGDFLAAGAVSMIVYGGVGVLGCLARKVLVGSRFARHTGGESAS